MEYIVHRPHADSILLPRERWQQCICIFAKCYLSYISRPPFSSLYPNPVLLLAVPFFLILTFILKIFSISNIHVHNIQYYILTKIHHLCSLRYDLIKFSNSRISFSENFFLVANAVRNAGSDPANLQIT